MGGSEGREGVCLASHGAQGSIRYNLGFPERLKPVTIGRTCGAARLEARPFKARELELQLGRRITSTLSLIKSKKRDFIYVEYCSDSCA